MLGDHCLKTWSKTQAIVAKSSAEAELYGVVRGATEGLGMVTLIKDLGGLIGVQMHVDASAAIGIIERQGLSRVRHIDTNVLWLQEVCAKKIVPVKKVPGELNPADLGTKHLAVAAIDKNVVKMRLSFEGGRAAKAAKLHSVDLNSRTVSPSVLENISRSMMSIGKRSGQGAWNAITRAANDLRGGDRWKSRGHKGIWHRWHVTPRRSLFTPNKIPKGPTSLSSIQATRFTCGVTSKGENFEIFDDWRDPECAHKLMDDDWIGFTIFQEQSGQNLDFQRSRSADVGHVSGKWADCE